MVEEGVVIGLKFICVAVLAAFEDIQFSTYIRLVAAGFLYTDIEYGACG